MNNKKIGDQFDGGNSTLQFVSIIRIHEDEFCKTSAAGISKESETNQTMESS